VKVVIADEQNTKKIKRRKRHLSLRSKTDAVLAKSMNHFSSSEDVNNKSKQLLMFFPSLAGSISQSGTVLAPLRFHLVLLLAYIINDCVYGTHYVAKGHFCCRTLFY
jgi:hypothetical protein